MRNQIYLGITAPMKSRTNFARARASFFLSVRDSTVQSEYTALLLVCLLFHGQWLSCCQAEQLELSSFLRNYLILSIH